MTLRPSLQKSLARTLGTSPDRRVRLSSVIRHDGGRRAVDLIANSSQFFVLTKETHDDAQIASDEIIDAAADLIEALGGTAEIA